MTARRLIVGDLDIETRWHRELGGPLSLSSRAQAALSAAATLLRVFAADDQCVLWTPSPVAPERVSNVAGLARPRLVSGDCEEADEVLAWADASRRRPGVASAWQAPAVDREIVRTVNHRRWAHALGQRLGVALPGSRWIESTAELGRVEGPWVLKPAFSAAGRDRLLGEGTPSPQQLARAERVIGGGGALLEPWVRRIEDFGWRGWVDEAGCRPDGVHRLIVDGGGRFHGIEIGGPVPAGVGPIGLDIGDALHRAGYRGPFTIDAFLFESEGGQQLAPLCELNARFSFGWVAAAAARRLGLSRMQLHIGRRLPAAVEERRVLLWPGTDPWCAWIEASG